MTTKRKNSSLKGYTKRPNGRTLKYVWPNGKKDSLPCDVYNAKEPVTIKLRLEHFQCALNRGGVGTTQSCMMAVCSEKHGDLFPFEFHHVVWTDKCALFLTEMRLGHRAKAVGYEHDDKLAALFDTAKGRKILLERLKTEKEIEVKLVPPRIRAPQTGSGKKTGKSNGERTSAYVPRTLGRRLARAIPIFQEGQEMQLAAMGKR